MCFNAASRIESRGSFDEKVDEEEEVDDEEDVDDEEEVDDGEEEEDGEEDITGEADEVTEGAELVETNLLVVFLVYVTTTRRLKKVCEILLVRLIDDIVEEWLLVEKIQTSSK